jgi:hypothetical protein
MKTVLLLVCLSIVCCASPALAAKHRHHHHVAVARAQAAPVIVPQPVYMAPLGPRTAPFGGSYGARDDVWGSCGHTDVVFSCPGN